MASIKSIKDCLPSKVNKRIIVMNYGPINIDPETMGGTSVFTGTRVPIKALFDYIESGESLNEFLENFPSVKKELAIQVLKMAGKLITNEKVLNDLECFRDA